MVESFDLFGAAASDSKWIVLFNWANSGGAGNGHAKSDF